MGLRHRGRGVKRDELQRTGSRRARRGAASTDYVRAWPQLIASYIDAPFTGLGTDGFGRSDTRAVLRRFFEIDRHHVVLAALTALRERGQVDAKTCAETIARYGLAPDVLAPWLA